MVPEPTTANPFLPSGAHLQALILDGGLATALEARGFDLNHELWSARLLMDAPDAIRRVHRDYLEAGADCITTASYQASLPGFARQGIQRERALELLRLATALAMEARDEFWDRAENQTGRRRPLVAASVGPYGAYLADGSEYTGDYPATKTELYEFHRERWHLFAQGPADLLACETIPSIREVSVLLDLLRETPGRQAWLSVSCRDAAHLSDGTPVGEVARLCDPVGNLAAVGLNCTKPEFIEPLLLELRRYTDKPLIAYPNAGEDYRVGSRSWTSPRSPVDWIHEAAQWLRLGVRGVGGCCRVGPDQIRSLRKALVL